MKLIKSVLPDIIFIVAGLIFVWLTVGVVLPAQAQTPPAQAARYQHTLRQQAHNVWGLDAPIAVFAAQLHQESHWQPGAVSRAGAQGMAQFMPATAKWWCEINGTVQADCQPHNPSWAIRSLIGYDLWLWDRLPVGDPGDRMWAVLRAYNGGLGHWQAESRNAATRARADIDAACGTAKRHPRHCPENLAYPRRIMIDLQPRYRTWGAGLDVMEAP